MNIGPLLLLALGASLLGNIVRFAILKVFTPPYEERLAFFAAMFFGLAVALFIILSGPITIGK